MPYPIGLIIGQLRNKLVYAKLNNNVNEQRHLFQSNNNTLVLPIYFYHQLP